MADLHGMLAAVFLEGGAHALGVIHGERHGLFLVHMLAGGDGRGEVLAVEVLRRAITTASMSLRANSSRKSL
jgi:hypothetical protein